MKKLLFGFLLAFNFIFGITNTKVEKIKALDKQIQILKLKQNELERLKKIIFNQGIKKQKIALVLSGGGSKGMAHIGVLKVIDQYKIPIDLIVGTSAGSIIGGMYSMGYSGQEIEDIVLKLNFFKFSTNSKDRKFRSLEEKLTDEKYPFKVNIDKKLNLSLPMGLLNGQSIYFTLKTIFSPAEKINDFNKLPIPFRAITTDLNTGKEVIIKNGDLALSTFKSMAIPTILDPIQDKNEYFVDGGVINNMAVNVAISEGATFVIAVDISADDEKITNNANIISILTKLSSYEGNQNFELEKKLADILIVPKVKHHRIIDFSNLKYMVTAGQNETYKYLPILKKFENKEKFEKIKKNKLAETIIHIEKIELRGSHILQEKKIKKYIKKGKSTFSNEELLNLAKKIYAFPYIERLFYDVQDNVLIFDIKEKKEIRIGTSLNFISNYGASINLKTNIPTVNNWIKNYTISGEISKYPKISLTSFSHYEFGNFNMISSCKLGYEITPYYVYEKSKKRAIYNSQNLKAEFSLGTSFSNNLIADVSLGYKNIRINYSEGAHSFNEFDLANQYIYINPTLYYDTLNNKAFPSSGILFSTKVFNGNNFKTGKSYQKYSASISKFFPVTDKFSFSLGGALGKITTSNNSPDLLFKLGGNKSSSFSYDVVGFPFIGKYADEFYIFSTEIKYKIWESLYLTGKYNLLTYKDTSLQFAKNDNLWKNKYHGYGFGLGWDTFIGPLSFTISNNIEGHSPIFEFYLGYIF